MSEIQEVNGGVLVRFIEEHACSLPDINEWKIKPKDQWSCGGCKMTWVCVNNQIDGGVVWRRRRARRARRGSEEKLDDLIIRFVQEHPNCLSFEIKVEDYASATVAARLNILTHNGRLVRTRSGREGFSSQCPL
jgi:hypothetical protein